MSLRTLPVRLTRVIRNLRQNMLHRCEQELVSLGAEYRPHVRELFRAR